MTTEYGHGVYQGDEFPQLKGKPLLYRALTAKYTEVQFDDRSLPQAYGWWSVLSSSIVPDNDIVLTEEC